MSELFVSLVALASFGVSVCLAGAFLRTNKEALAQVQSIRRIEVLSDERDKVELALTRAELALAETHTLFLWSYGCAILTVVLVVALVVSRLWHV